MNLKPPQAINHRGPGIKHWRLIVRNLAFDTTKEDIEQWADKFGKILEIRLPKCKDKRFPKSCAGFCFIQFARRSDAERASKELNFTELKGRKVAVDWALDKDSWVTKEQQGKSELKTEVKKEEPEEDEVKILSKNTKKFDVKVKEEQTSDEDENDESASDSGDSENDDEETEDEAEENVDEEEEEEDDGKEIKQEANKKKEVREDPAICEGKVIFLRNVPFSATDEQLKEWLEKQGIGEVKLAILCRSKQTGDPTGTAFVHFVEKDAAEAFLEKLGTREGLLLDGRKLIGHRAVKRSEAKEFKLPEENKKLAKDKRNLYLLRASLIRPGTAQAKEMSEEDAKARAKLAELARNKLKNLIMFVSPFRLVVHNIPFAFTDVQLRELCQKAAASTSTSTAAANPSIITECRIMRDRKGEDQKGRPILGKSKGFAFVTFRSHESALQCLRQMNNDTKMFTNERRPIVEFSIENLNALRTKERRLKMSKGEEPVDKANSKSKEEEKQKFKSGSDPRAVERTKRELMAGGRKWMPKKFGVKVRHRDAGKKSSSSKQHNKPGAKNNNFQQKAPQRLKKRRASDGSSAAGLKANKIRRKK